MTVSEGTVNTKHCTVEGDADLLCLRSSGCHLLYLRTPLVKDVRHLTYVDWGTLFRSSCCGPGTRAAVCLALACDVILQIYNFQFLPPLELGHRPSSLLQHLE